jgi:hypothetical protein
MNNDIDDTVRWNAKHDVFRPRTEFNDLLRIVACYYEMYSRACEFLGPWIAKQHGNSIFIPPDADQLKAALGRERPALSFRARSSFVSAIIQFLAKTKGKKMLIAPSPTSHHSAQFPSGTFQVTMVQASDMVQLRDDTKTVRKPTKTLHRIEFAGAEEPVYVENLNIPTDQIKFIILRPKLGKLGTPSASRWEVLLYKRDHGYLVQHVDSHLNPRWSGIM